MTPFEINFMIGGEAGQGVQSAGFLLAKVFARGGFHVFADQEYESRVRGGHNFYRVRVSDSPVSAISERVDILIALNRETIDRHRKEVSRQGLILFDNEAIPVPLDQENLSGVPFTRLAEEQSGNKMAANTVALGAALGIIKYDFALIETLLKDYFSTDEIRVSNIKSARAGFEYTLKNSQWAAEFNFNYNRGAGRMLLNGNEAIALGAIAAGCKFIAAYPMTPVTSIMEYLAPRAKELGIVVLQPEDEMAAVNMVIGAGYAGARAMTATSGSGFSLMVEGLGLAGMTETPVVIVNGQRPGPAIGLPTGTEQGDLEFAIHAHQGDFPRAVLAPATIEDAFWLTISAFNIAEKYQVPVILLTDHHLASSYGDVDKFDISKVTIDRGSLYPGESAGVYKRYQVTDSGVSPRAFPGLGRDLVVADADEHGEDGHLTEVPTTRVRMMKKRMKKLIGLKSEVIPPKTYGPREAKTTLIGWGSTYGAIREAVDLLNDGRERYNMIHLTQVWPFPTDQVLKGIEDARNCYVIESNAAGQLAHLARAETGRRVTSKILKFDGRPFTPADIVREIKKEELVEPW
jgi:2-oxoglutarate ferredoxin oxidoreductase subunit alpha